MKQIRYIAIVTLICTLLGCENASQQAAQITKVEQEMKQDAAKGTVDTAKVAKLIDLYQAYIKTYPTDSLCPVYLMRSGDFFRGSMMPAQAVVCYVRVAHEYPRYTRANLALFLSAFLYENELHDLSKAKTSYEQYLSLYPTSKLAKDAAISLKNLGKSPDQILQEIDSTQSMKSNSTLHQRRI